jgi:hypothetical protein
MAIRNVIGKYPTYMRPPYSACYSASCQDDLKALGYVVTSFDLDTDDYNQLSVEKIQIAKDNFKKGVDSAGPEGDRLSISHDIHELTALNLTGYMLDYVYKNGWTAVTVGECMNDPVENWYRDSTPGVKPSPTPSSSMPVPTPTGPTSIDGMCGSTSVQSCIGFVGPDGLGECCSPSGWCGRTDAYCGTGCNPLFGKCGPQPSVVPPVIASTTSAAPLPTIFLTTSTDGTCGIGAAKTCKGFTLDGAKAECCSQYGFCGANEAYCGTGCNPLYGNCGLAVSSSSVSASVSVSASANAFTSSSVSVSMPESVSSLASTSASSVHVSSSASVSALSVPASSSTSASSSVVVTSASHSSSVAASSTSASRSVVSASPSAYSTTVHSSSVLASASSSSHGSSSVPVSHSSSATASANLHESSSTMAHSSSASASASVTKQDISSIPESKTSLTPVHVFTSESASMTPSTSIPGHDATSSPYPTSTPDVHSTHTPNVASSATPNLSSSPASISKDNSSPSSSFSATMPADKTSTPLSTPSTMSTIVRPSSTSCTENKVPTPTPTGPPVSKDGKCGKDNGGQTCAGYKNSFGQVIECCCKESGRCSTDPWACGVGCDKGFGKCNGY